MLPHTDKGDTKLKTFMLMQLSQFIVISAKSHIQYCTMSSPDLYMILNNIRQLQCEKCFNFKQ